MNFKNKYLLKNQLKLAYKKCKKFNIYNVVFFWKHNEYHLEISLFYTIIFCSFTLPSAKIQKIRILKKMKKTAKDIITLHMCTKNHDHMRYSSWDRHYFLSFWDIFCPLPVSPRNNLKNQNFEKMKKVSGDAIILHK